MECKIIKLVIKCLNLKLNIILYHIGTYENIFNYKKCLAKV